MGSLLVTSLNPHRTLVIAANHLSIKHRLLGICSLSEFMSILDKCTLSDEQKQILILHYVKDKPLTCIADELGWSYTTIKRKHFKALKKISNSL